jgi:hypothetical protein
MKLEMIVAIALINRFALSFLCFVFEYVRKGHCHAQIDERRLSSSLVVHRLLNSRHFGLLTCQFELELNGDYGFNKNNRYFGVHTTS